MAITVTVRDGEPLELALRRFKKACERNGIPQELKRREYYQKPSVLRHAKKTEKKRRLAKLCDKPEETDMKYDKVFDKE